MSKREWIYTVEIKRGYDDPICFVDPPPRPVCQCVETIKACTAKLLSALPRSSSGKKLVAVSVVDLVVVHSSTFLMLSIGTSRFLFSA